MKKLVCKSDSSACWDGKIIDNRVKEMGEGKVIKGRNFISFPGIGKRFPRTQALSILPVYSLYGLVLPVIVAGVGIT